MPTFETLQSRTCNKPERPVRGPIISGHSFYGGYLKISQQFYFCFTVSWNWASTAGVGNLRPTDQMRPTWTLDIARIRIFVTPFKVQNRVKTKLHDKQMGLLKVECH